jgi:asparagine synthase (glutamine-hydrolysing)
MKTAAEKLQLLIERAVEKRLVGLNNAALAFSGGLDSSIIAYLSKKSPANVQLLHVSLKDQDETEHAKTVAEELGLPLHVHTYTEDDVRETFPLVLHIIEEADPVKASIGIPIYWAAEQAAKTKLKVMLAGQGSDELFAGYKRYVDDYMKEGAEKSQEAICRDILTLHENNFERDSKICKFHGIEMRLPFATYEIADFASKLPVELKIQPSTDTLRKLVLRQVAHNLGLSKATVERPKKAVQYATGVNNALRRLAKRRHQTLEEYTKNTFQDTMKR